MFIRILFVVCLVLGFGCQRESVTPGGIPEIDVRVDPMPTLSPEPLRDPDPVPHSSLIVIRDAPLLPKKQLFHIWNENSALPQDMPVDGSWSGLQFPVGEYRVAIPPQVTDKPIECIFAVTDKEIGDKETVWNRCTSMALDKSKRIMITLEPGKTTYIRLRIAG